jgi:hypothetical protein
LLSALLSYWIYSLLCSTLSYYLICFSPISLCSLLPNLLLSLLVMLAPFCTSDCFSVARPSGPSFVCSSIDSSILSSFLFSFLLSFPCSPSVYSLCSATSDVSPSSSASSAFGASSASVTASLFGESKATVAAQQVPLLLLRLPLSLAFPGFGCCCIRCYLLCIGSICFW